MSKSTNALSLILVQLTGAGHRFDRFVEKTFPTDESRKLMVDVLSGFLELVEQESVPMEQVMVNGEETYSPID
jgi:hypothetical protein